uniref:Uncharacterized protein n=1 Tax=Glossina austeni TaxID=7395 RepID=A0A1A9UI47_GLOAU
MYDLDDSSFNLTRAALKLSILDNGTINIYGRLFSLLRHDEVVNIDDLYLSGLAVVLGLVLLFDLVDALFGAPVDIRDVNFDDPAEIAAAALKSLPFILSLREDFVLNSDVDLIVDVLGPI